MTLQTVLRPANTHEISASTTTARNSTAFTRSDIGIYCDTAVFVKLGGSDVEATTTAGSGYDMHIPAGARVDISTGGATHVAVITNSGSDTVYINEWTNKAL